MNNKWYASGFIIVINIILFLLCTFDGGMLYNIGGISPYSFFEEKEYYRLVSSMFLHGDIQHLVNNMLLLFGLGLMIEKEIGHLAFAAAYMVSGIGGNIVSLFFKIHIGEWYVESIGASGAVFGLIGVLLMLALFLRGRLPNVTPIRILIVIAYSIYSNWGNGRIDNAAHFGGVIVGATAGAAICLIKHYITYKL